MVVARPVHEVVTENARRGLLMLLGATGLLLLIACTNVANLLLARAVARERDLAVRASLGAGRTRLFGQVMGETVALIERYARAISAPVRTHTRVLSVRTSDEGYSVATSRGEWRCRALVLASGACSIASVPALARALPAGIASLTPFQYRNPGELDPGGVLVVGAAASGVQLADEIRRSGRHQLPASPTAVSVTSAA